MEYIDKVFEKLKKFRLSMGLPVTQNDIKYIWGKRYLKDLRDRRVSISKDIENKCREEKIDIAKEYISKLKVFNWVKFIGISGSVAAGFTKDDDDIDIYVVVKNNTAWLYRGIVVLRNLFHNRVRAKRHRVIKNKLCVNLINEERGVQFTNDMFNFHELMYLIPIYSEDYLKYIYSKNSWLFKEYYVKKDNLNTKITKEKEVIFLIKWMNHLAFLSQIIFMKISGHKPDIKRLKENYRNGKIEFFEYDYKEKVLQKN